MICRKCGSEIADGEDFCHKCRKKKKTWLFILVPAVVVIAAVVLVVDHRVPGGVLGDDALRKNMVPPEIRP